MQHRLAAAILALNKPTVIFMLNGGAVSIAPELASHAAIVESFYPGFEGAKAIARSLFGHANRWGRMPYTTYHADWAAQNNMTQMDVAASNRTYRYGADALVPFGAGQSLTQFNLSFAASGGADRLRTSCGAGASAMTVKVEVTNAGKLEGDEVVQLYLLPKAVGVPRHPVKALIDFARVRSLAPGATREVVFELRREALLLATEAGDLACVPGQYELSVEDGAGERLTRKLTVTGPQAIVVPFPS